MKVYIAGPMRGYPEFNFPAFDSLDAYLKNVLCWATVNPAQHDRDAALEVKGVNDITQVPGYAEGDLSVYEHTLGQVYDLLTWDVAKIATECDGIVMLPNWEKSTGSRIERFVAESLNKRIWLATWDAPQATTTTSASPPLANGWWVLTPDDEKRMSVSVLENAA